MSDLDVNPPGSGRGPLLGPGVIAATPLAAGLVLLFVTAGLLVVTRTPGNMSATTAGTVTSVQVAEGSTLSRRWSSLVRPNEPSCVPVAEFAVGRTKNRTSRSVGVSSCPWAVGQRVTVAYDPAQPSQAVIQATGLDKYLPSGILGTTGLLALVLSFVRWRRRAQGRQHRDDTQA